MTDIAELGLEIKSDGVVVASNRLKNLENQSGRTENASKRMAAQFKDVGRQMRQLAVLGAAAMAALSANSLRLAIDAEETANKFRVVFRGSIEQSNKELIELTKTIPLTLTQMRGLAAGVQDMLVPMGVARDRAAGMSVDMVRLAGDLASFNNVPTTRVLEAMQSALAGSSEPMRRFGVDTRVTRLEQIALRDGLIGAGDEMDNAAMAAATLTAIMEDSSDAAGDAARTVNSAANQLRFMGRNVNQLQEDLGSALLPAFNDLLSSLNNNSQGMSSLETAARGVASTVLIVAAGVSMLSAGFVILAKRMAQVVAVSNEIIDNFKPNFEFSDLFVPGAALSKLVGGLKEGADNAQGMSNRIREINLAANEDVSSSTTGIFEMFDAFIEGAQALRGTIDRSMQETDAASSSMNLLGDATVKTAKDAEKAKKAFDELMKTQNDFVSSIEDIEAEISGDSAQAMLLHTRSVSEANRLYAAGVITLGQYERALAAYSSRLKMANAPESTFENFINFDLIFDSLDEMRDRMREISRIDFGFERMLDSFDPLSSAMRQLGDDIALVNARIENGSMSQMDGMFVKTAASASAAFGAMMSGVDQTSSEYKKLEKAQRITNVALGIAAILQQGMGDPYTAIPRMAAMAAMVASLGVDAGSVSGGSSSRRQTQGTGTVLGDTEAQSESIANAVEITADATSKLVGINRGMLHSLQALQKGIGSASGMIARGAGGLDFSGLSLGRENWEKVFGILDPILSAIDGFIGGLFGFGKTKVKDQGIALLGGAITEMTEGAVAMAFADLKRKSLFGSSKKTVFEDLDSAFNEQLNLIFASMIETVEQAGEALGIPLEDIQQRIEQFEVRAVEISLKDLSAEEQQAELEAVFSAIFDDLASAVIPFIGQFQKVGEGMGETLVRVATSVQVAQEAIRRLGLSIEDDLGPERMAQVSVGLVEAAGGIDRFISSMENFIAKFAPEAHKFDIAQSDITRALEQMGITLPATREGFWDLLQSMDATTEAGQQQIATLLGLADAADAYYNQLEQIQNERESLERQLLEIQGESEAIRKLELEQIDESNRALQERIWQLQREQELSDLLTEVGMQALRFVAPARAEYAELARSINQAMEEAERLGASERQLAFVRQASEIRIRQFIASLSESIADLSEQLFGTGPQIDALGGTLDLAASSAGNFRDQWLSAIDRISDALDAQLLGPNSSLTAEERQAESVRQFNEALAAAQAGDLDAAQSLPALFNEAIAQGAAFFGSTTSEFESLEEQLRQALESANLPVPPESPEVQTAANTAATVQAVEQSAMDQLLAATQLIDQIGLLADLTGRSPAEIGAEFGIPIAELIGILTGEVPDLTGDALSGYFDDLVAETSAQLNELAGIEQIGNAQLSVLESIRDLLSMGEIPTLPDQFTTPIPGYADGGPVIQTGPALVHAGEFVVPAGGALVSSGSAMTERILSEIRDEIKLSTRLEDEQLREHRISSRESVRAIKRVSEELRSHSTSKKPALAKS